MECSEIKNGKYTVTIKFKVDLCSKIKEALHKESEFNGVYCIDRNNFKYESETILPLDAEDTGKQKILMVFGNPAIHSVEKGMFYFSKTPKFNKDKQRDEYSKHQMWGKLEKAGLIKNVDAKGMESLDKRKKEADARRELILKGKTCDQYLLGLTTFYSLPTPVTGYYRNVEGVKRVFGKTMLPEIQEQEIKRIFSYEFAKEALLIFVQKSTYEIFKSKAPGKIKYAYWPGVTAMRTGSGGKDLKIIIFEYMGNF